MTATTITTGTGSSRQWVETMITVQRLNHRPAGLPPSPQEFVMVHGIQYGPSLPVKRKAIARMCFRNAYRFAMRKRYTYVEGWATNMIPTEHAWCVDGQGRVVDPTWGENGIDYFGVPLPLDVVARCHAVTESYSVVSAWWAWEKVHPILAEHFGQA